MLQNTLLRRASAATPLLRRAMSTEAASGSMTLSFNLPHETIYSEAQVSQVIVPGAAGEYGVTADHVPLVAQLKPGVLQILHEGSSEVEKYFVAGGWSITHPGSKTVSFVLVGDVALAFFSWSITLLVDIIDFLVRRLPMHRVFLEQDAN